MIVPSPLNIVIELPNNITDIHIRNARLTVFATLKYIKKHKILTSFRF